MKDIPVHLNNYHTHFISSTITERSKTKAFTEQKHKAN